MSMILPTLLVAIDITWRSWTNRADFFHNLAVSLWIAANAIWMTGEFFFEDSWRPGARVFFALGFVVLGRYYVPLI